MGSNPGYLCKSFLLYQSSMKISINLHRFVVFSKIWHAVNKSRRACHLQPSWLYYCAVVHCWRKQINLRIYDHRLNEGKPAAQVSNKIDLRHGWNLLLKSTIKNSVLCQGSTIETSCRWKLSDISKVSVGKPRYLILPNDWQIGLLDYQIIRI